MNKFLEQKIKELHLEWASKVYASITDESKMTADEIKSKRAQIPQLGRVPFESAANEMIKLLWPCVEALKHISGDMPLRSIHAALLGIGERCIKDPPRCEYCDEPEAYKEWATRVGIK